MVSSLTADGCISINIFIFKWETIEIEYLTSVQGFAVVKNAKRHKQEANSWEFQSGRISYTVIITYYCSRIFATH